MPIYLYQHPKTKKTKEVIQGMVEEHTFVDDKGVKWNRIFTVPQAVVDGRINPFSEADFVKKTGNGKNQKVGDLWDRSKELSEKRAAKNGGVDPIKDKFLKEYSKKRKGKPHPSQIRGDKTYTI